MSDAIDRRLRLPWPSLRRAYDVVIIGGGGHGLACAYYLACRHQIRNVAVLERRYIGAGNSGRSTTVIRANYGIPEAVRFYQRSLEAYETLSGELDRDLLHRTRGVLWLAHSEATLRSERARAELNRAYGAETSFLSASEVAAICPLIDTSDASGYPVLGASWHPRAATARHDRVVWAYAEAALRLGVHIHQGVEVTGLRVQHGRLTGVDTTSGVIDCGTALAAVGGFVSPLAATANLRLPITTHPLHAAVTNHYAATLEPIIASADLLFYVSQTPRGELLFGAEIEPQPSYDDHAGYRFLAACARRLAAVIPSTSDLRVLRQWAGLCDMSPDYSPIMGRTGIDGLLVSTGWGTWGFKAIPASGEGMAELIATGQTPALIAPFSLERFARGRLLADRGSAGTH